MSPFRRRAPHPRLQDPGHHHLPHVMVIAMIWLERRVVAWIQGRIGPNRVGWQGILQPFADAVKLFFKEDIIQVHADKFLFNLAPVLVMASTLLSFCFLPWASPSASGPTSSALGGRKPRGPSSLWACPPSRSSGSSSAAGSQLQVSAHGRLRSVIQS